MYHCKIEKQVSRSSKKAKKEKNRREARVEELPLWCGRIAFEHDFCMTWAKHTGFRDLICIAPGNTRGTSQNKVVFFFSLVSVMTLALRPRRYNQIKPHLRQKMQLILKNRPVLKA